MSRGHYLKGLFFLLVLFFCFSQLIAQSCTTPPSIIDCNGERPIAFLVEDFLIEDGIFDQSTMDDLNWRVNSGSSGSINTGPAGDACPDPSDPGNNTGGYLYVESSNPATYGSIACITTINGGFPMNLLTGQQQLSSGDPWDQLAVDLMGFQGSMVDIEFCYTIESMSSCGLDSNADFAIDQFTVWTCADPTGDIALIDDSCSCDDPENYLFDGNYYYHEVVQITSDPGENWVLNTITSGQIYGADSMLLTLPLTLTETPTGSGNYIGEFWHINNIGFNAIFIETLNGGILGINNSCRLESIDITCPLDLNLGTFDCNDLDSFPDCPTDQASIEAAPYNIRVNDFCGELVVECTDDFSNLDLCPNGSPSFVVRTITVIDDLNGNGRLDSGEQSSDCEYMIDILPTDEEPTIDCTGLGGIVTCSALLTPSTPIITTGCNISSTLNTEGPVIDTIQNCPGFAYTYTHTVTDSCGRSASCDERFLFIEPAITDIGDCTYFLVMEDAQGDGWDGASITLSVNEELPAIEYKTLCFGDFGIYPIDVSSGSLIDIAYWNGANEVDHAWKILRWDLTVATDVNGNLMMSGYDSEGNNTVAPLYANNEVVRGKASCPECCVEETRNFSLSIDVDDNDPVISWQFVETFTGEIVMEKGQEYYSEFNVNDPVEVFSLNLDLSKTYRLDVLTGALGDSVEISSSDPSFGVNMDNDEEMEVVSGIQAMTNDFTLPCPPDCEDIIIMPIDSTLADSLDAILVDCDTVNNVFIQVDEPKICYPNCDQYTCRDGIISSVSINGDTLFGVGLVGPFDSLSLGEQEVIIEHEYCDGVVTRCRFTLSLTTVNNPVMICNDLIHQSISIDLEEGCEVVIVPDMIMEAIEGCQDEYIVEILTEDLQAIRENSNIVDSDDAGKTLVYRVRHAGSENLCWGYIKVEDKVPPVISCEDYEVPCTHPQAFDELFPSFPTAATAEDCSEHTLSLIDETLVETDCDHSDWNGAKIIRTYQAIDIHGNSSTCQQTVNLKIPTMEDIVLPPDVALECRGNESEDFPVSLSGTISFEGFPITELQHGLCDISFTYEDQVFNACGQSFEIIRTWTIVNWCTEQSILHEQIIKIEDTDGPTIDQDIITLSTNSYNNCSGTVNLSHFDIADECSDVVSVGLSYWDGAILLGEGELVVVDLLTDSLEVPIGITEVTITAKDECLNETQKEIAIIVEDNQLPIPVCSDGLHMSLGGDGEVWLYVDAIDKGSHDNCGDVSLAIRRTDGCLGISRFSESVQFVCCDANQFINIELLVTDAAGNSNVCWKKVLVEDALPPIISCAEDITINCDDPNIHDPFTEPTGSDNCRFNVRIKDTELDQCKSGLYTRTWTASDGSIKSPDVSCSQTVTVLHVSDFVVQFPEDLTLDGCSIERGGEPIVTDADCELVSVTSEDVFFDIVEEACYKIERTWTVINWCNYEQGNPANTNLGIPLPVPRTYRDDDGYFKYVQTLNVLDNEPPIINCSRDTSFCDLTNDCEGRANFSISATDECSPEEAMEYNYKIDAFNDGSFDIIGEGNSFSGTYPYGTHLLKWIVEDGCGNTSQCTQLFTIEDCKNPTPVCRSGLSIPAMNSNGCVEILATDFLDKAWDNCTEDAFVEGSVKIRRDGDTGALQDKLTLCCEDLGTVVLEIWVFDEAGNSDFCTTYVILQDNTNFCDDNDSGSSSAMIAGNITDEMGQHIKEVTVHVNGENYSNAIPTDGIGHFMFPDLAVNTPHSIVPEKLTGPLNGVTTSDIVLITKHILGLAYLDSPYKLIAADFNKDGKITTSDVIEIRRFILFINTDFTNNTSWRFIDKDYIFPDPTNPWLETFPEKIDLVPLQQNEVDADFIGVKIGDVNGNALANFNNTEERNNQQELVFYTQEQQLEKGNTITVDFFANDFEKINGFQFTLSFDNSVLKFVEIQKGEFPITEANFGLNLLNEGIITSSYNKWEEIDNNSIDKILFSITFESLKEILLSEVVEINSRYTVAEAYDLEEEVLDISLEFIENDKAISSFKLYQNNPNPFSNTTTIGFDLGVSSYVTFEIYDYSGKILKTIQGDYPRGYNELSLDFSTLSTGVLFYKMYTKDFMDSKKMILID